MKKLIFLVLSGCVTAAPPPQLPPEEPRPIPQAPEPQEPEETPDDVFNREVDACFVEYRKCQRAGKPESVCFPPQEECVVTAYRKLKKSRGQ